MSEKRTSRSKHIDFIILDLICVEASFLLAYFIRLGDIRDMGEDYALMNVIMLLVHISVAFFMERYSGILRRGFVKELKEVIVHNCAISALIFTILFLVKQSSTYSRIMLVMFFGINTILMYLVRSVRKRYLLKNKVKIKNKRRMLLVAYTHEVEEVLSKLLKFQYAGYTVAGVVVLDEDMTGRSISGIPVVANGEQVIEYVKNNIIDEVFLKCIDQADRYVDSLITMGVAVHISVENFMRSMPNANIKNVSDYTVITSSINNPSFKQRVIKRAMDIVGALVGLVITAILFIIFAPIIYIQSPGPVFFKQDRVGKNGRIFKIRKFRSMYLDAEERKKELMEQNKMSGHMFKMDNDPRIIPIGRFIRRTSIDEFPQFWNVLMGDMSLVGTRPPTLDEVEKYELHHKSRLAVKPGLTGVWQTSGRSDITDFEEVVRLDNEYIKNFSLGLDVKLLWKTVWIVLGRKGSV